jgi:hypothetical protein
VLTEHGYRLLDRFFRGAASRGDQLPARADNAGGPAPTPVP